MLFAATNSAALSAINDLTMRVLPMVIPILMSQRFNFGVERARLGEETSQMAIKRKTVKKDVSLIDDSKVILLYQCSRY